VNFNKQKIDKLVKTLVSIYLINIFKVLNQLLLGLKKLVVGRYINLLRKSFIRILSVANKGEV